MIKVTKTLEILGAEFPIKYNLDLPECAKLISSSVDEESKCLILELEFCDTNCIENYTPFNLEIIDSTECSFMYELNIQNVCDGLYFLNDIYELDNCSECDIALSAPVFGKGNYFWKFDDKILSLKEQDNYSAYFYLLEDQVVTDITTTIEVVVTNDNNCSISTSYSLDLKLPYHIKETKGTNCARIPKTFNTVPKTEVIKPLVLNDEFIDYDTLVITDSKADEIHYLNGGFQLTYESSETEYIDEVKFEVLDCRGVRVRGIICVNVEACSIIVTPNPGGPVYTFGPEFCNNPQEIIFDISEYILLDNPDYTTFTLFPNIGDTVVDPYILDTTIGQIEFTANQTLVIDFNGNVPDGCFSVPYSINGVQGFIDFKGYPCNSLTGEIPSSFNICTIAGSETSCYPIGEKITGLPDGYTLFIKDYPPTEVTISIQNNNDLCYVADSDFSGIVVFSLGVLNNDGIEVDSSTIYLEVVQPKDAIIVGQCELTIDLNPYWDFSKLIPPKIYYCGETNFTYTTPQGASITVEPNTIISGSVFEADTIGTYIFKDSTGVEACNQDQVVEFNLTESILFPDFTTEVCVSTEVFDLNCIPDLPEGGTWISNENLDSFSETYFSPNQEGVGVYTFRWTKEYENCTSTFLLTVIVIEEPEVICPKCITLCSYGKDCECDPCVESEEEQEDCIYDLYDLFGLPIDSILYLKEAPYTPIILNINGMLKGYSNGDQLPLGQINWKASSAPIGVYTFYVEYGGVCKFNTEFKIELKKAVCSLDDSINIEVCASDPEINLFDLIDTTGTCLQNNIGSLELISENLTSSGEVSYNLETGTFYTTASGQWVFSFTATVENGDPNCQACLVSSTVTVTSRPIPGPGLPNPGAVCNDGACFVNVYPDMFTPNQSILGIFIYDGFTPSITMNPNPTGGWGGVEPAPTSGTEVTPGFNFEGAQEGFYFFTNTVIDEFGCTSSSQTIVQVVSAGTAGTGQIVDYCTDDIDCLDLFPLLTGADPGGSWSVTNGNPTTAFNTCDEGIYIAGDSAQFNITNQSVGTYTFTYTLTNPPAIYPLFNGCNACDGGFAEVTVIISQSADAGSSTPIAVCD